MPSRQLPRTDQERSAAVMALLAEWGLVAVNARPYPLELHNQIVAQEGPWSAATTAVGTAKSAQVDSTKASEKAGLLLAYHISHFIQGFDNAALREVYAPGDRAIFQLPATGRDVPPLDAHNDRVVWANNIIRGEAARATKDGPGYKAMANPSADEVAAALALYAGRQGIGSTLQGNYDRAQEAVAPLRAPLDGLIKEAWDALEYYFRHDDPASRRRKCRRWGIVYVPRPGEPPEEDEPEPPAPTPPPA